MSQDVAVRRNTAIRGARRIAIIAIIGSLSITAIIGIITLLTGEFGETQGKILLTTLLMAAFSITTLCHLAVAGRALRIVGFIGIAVSVLALVAGIVLIWQEWNASTVWEELLKAFIVFSILAVSFAHANLLLLLGDRKAPLIRLGLFATVAFIAVVAILLIIPVMTEGEVPGENADTYWRIFGVVAILDVLGTIVLPVINRFVRDVPGEARAGQPGTTLILRLSPELEAKLAAIAAARSLSREEIIAEAIERLPE